MLDRPRRLARTLLPSLKMDLRKALPARIPAHAPADVAAPARTLQEEGIVVLEDHVPTDRVDALRKELDAFLEPFDGTTELDNGTVVGFRGTDQPWDQGMIDVGHVDRSVPGAAAFRDDATVAAVVEAAAGRPFEPASINAYVNRSVTNTRGYHLDAYDSKYKAFLYLTDVETDADGPYAYVRGSHRFTWAKYRNLWRNAADSDRPLTDMPVHDPGDEVHVLGTRGTVVVSDQNGFHRGIPQEEGHERMLLATHYAPADG